MAESAHYQQLGKFVVLFQRLESSLIEIIDVIADEDYVVEILPAETGTAGSLSQPTSFFPAVLIYCASRT